MTERNIDHIALTVRDLSAMADFYAAALGLSKLDGDGQTLRLGADGRTLLELRRDQTARIRDPHQAGLFHTAFLLPKRADLAAWLRHADDTGIRLTGASDHGVSEAIYLDDPEGNGIEIYCDRPKAGWVRDGDRIGMYTNRLDLADLAAAARYPWVDAPAGSTIGHVHLQVGDLATADGFFTRDLDLVLTNDAQGGSWYGWNGYHHQIACNIWNSRGAGQRDPAMAGLSEVVVQDAARAGQSIVDPWGTPFRFV